MTSAPAARAMLAVLSDRYLGEIARYYAAQSKRMNALIESGQAYVGFAIDRPGIFRIMFRPEHCDLSRFPEARAAGEGHLVLVYQQPWAPEVRPVQTFDCAIKVN